MASHQDKKIMCVGLACVDIISICKSFPEEDSDQRSLDYYWRRGGNASNSSSVLGLLGAKVEFMGTLYKGQELGFLKSDFEQYGVNIDNCVIHESDKCPVAIVIINKQNGSRTILAALNNLIELTFDEFDDRVDLNEYKWIHFEGRSNVEHIIKMMEKINNHNAGVTTSERVTVSLEIEKPKITQFKELMVLADYVFVSKEFSIAQGYKCKEDAVHGLVGHSKQGGTVFCAWGEDGAAAKTLSHDLMTSPIFPPANLVDTLGAGDTFNASAIYALSENRCLKDAITFGCKLAGAKCGMTGNKGLKGLQNIL